MWFIFLRILRKKLKNKLKKIVKPTMPVSDKI